MVCSDICAYILIVYVTKHGRSLKIGQYAQVLIEDKTNAQEMLLALKEHYQYTYKEKERDMKERAKKLTSLNKSMSIDKWVEEWMIVYHVQRDLIMISLRRMIMPASASLACFQSLQHPESPIFMTKRIMI